MTDSIDHEVVTQVARLANLHFSTREIETSGKQLTEILQYFSQLQPADLPDTIEPFFGIGGQTNSVRADELRPSSGRDSIMSNAPATDGEFYLVPPVFK